MSIQDAHKVAMMDCLGVHNFSLGTLDAYFNLNDCLKSGKGGLVAPGLLSLTGRTGKVKTWLFNNTSDLTAWVEYRKKGPLYALSPIVSAPIKGTPFEEVVYDLEQVFNPASYPTAKKRAQRLKYPLKWLEDRGVRHEPICAANFPIIKQLHDEWAKHKLDDPNTFKMMFPTKRYIACAEKCLPRKVTGLGLTSAALPVRVDYRGWLYYVNGEPVACRVISIQGSPVQMKTYGFDLAFFGDTWSTESQMMTYLNVYSLRHIMEQCHVEMFNCGDSLNKSLKASKSHYPHFSCISYAYPQEKNK